MAAPRPSNVSRTIAARACPVCGAARGERCHNLMFQFTDRRDTDGKPRYTSRSIARGKPVRTTSRRPCCATYAHYVHAARRLTPPKRKK